MSSIENELRQARKEKGKASTGKSAETTPPRSVNSSNPPSDDEVDLNDRDKIGTMLA